MAMIRTKSVVLVSLLTLGFVLAGLVQRSEAQVLFGSVSGTVTDQSGATVSKAHISSVNRATGVQKETDADAGGHYTLTDLSPGAYDVTVTATGFKPLTQTDVRVGANVVTNTNFNLQIGSVSEKVTVEAAAVTLQTEKTDVHTEIPAKAIQEMPLNQYRNYQTLINLVPGATPGGFQNAIAEKSLGLLQEAYTNAFDLRPDCTPNLGYHLFGDDGRRGLFLAELKGRMEIRGIRLGVELPDHITLLLRYVDIADEEERLPVIEDCLLPAVARMVEVLKPSGNPYEHALSALLSLIRHQHEGFTRSAETVERSIAHEHVTVFNILE